MVIDYLSRMSTIQRLCNYRCLSRSPMHHPNQGVPHNAHTDYTVSISTSPFQTIMVKGITCLMQECVSCPMPSAEVPHASSHLISSHLMPHAQCRGASCRVGPCLMQGAPWWCGVCVCVCVCVWLCVVFALCWRVFLVSPLGFRLCPDSDCEPSRSGQTLAFPFRANPSDSSLGVSLTDVSEFSCTEHVYN